jgi:hypothetical protein
MRMLNGLTYVLAIGLGSCMSSGPTTLIVTGTNFGGVEGKAMKLAVVDTGANQIFETAAATTVSNGKFTFSLMVNPGTKYRVDLYADDDGDGHCQYGVDHAYAVDENGLAEGQTVTATVDYNSTDARGCLSFGAGTLHVTVTNFTATGHVFKAMLIRDDGGLKLGLKTDSLQGNAIDFTWAGAVIPHKFYHVDLYIDNNGDDHCGGSDTVFSQLSGAIGGTQMDGLLVGPALEVAMDGMHDLNPAACASFQ